MLSAASLLAAGLAVSGGAAPPSDDAWLRGRTNLLLEAIGSPPGSVRAVIVGERALSIPGPGEPIRVPSAAIALAHSEAEVDGLLAVLLSYRSAADRRRHVRGASVLSAIAYAGLIAATGGASDPSESSGSRVIPLGFAEAGNRERDAASSALRAARWNSAVGHCTSTLVNFLRILGADQSAVGDRSERAWRGSAFARTVIRQLGMLASPSAESCPADAMSGPSFAAAREAANP